MVVNIDALAREESSGDGVRVYGLDMPAEGDQPPLAAAYLEKGSQLVQLTPQQNVST